MRFYGYRRPDGKVGIRNHVVVMPGVICADVAARKIASATGAVYLHNPHGCGQTPSDTARTLHILSGLLANPNVYGALIVGLGCETLDETRYTRAIKERSRQKRIGYISIQACGGIAKTAEEGIRIVRELKDEADKCRRVECSLSELILGLECGGSDPTSGISANVVLGEVSDRLVDSGGTTVISETVEAIGAEEILRARGATPEIGQAIYDCIRNKEKAFAAIGEDIRKSNPSPGNIRSGITTLEEKSLGCINKSGTRPFTALVGYGDPVEASGVVFMDTTAFDAASTTAKIAGGCQAVVFTTGLGNPIGSAIAPVVKITGNKDTYDFLTDLIDFDSSGTLTGEKTVLQSADELMDLLIRVCSGEPVKAEINGADVISIDQYHMLA
jgi:altronate dehydratase large subunit